MKPGKLTLASLCAAMLLAACGGGRGGDPGSPIPNEPWARGALLLSPPAQTASFSAAALKLRLLAGGPADVALLLMTGDPVCGVKVHSIQYSTVGGRNEQTTASAALMLPTGGDPVCSGERPIVLSAHGTNPAKAYNLADLNEESNAAHGEAMNLAAFYAARGYIVVAPNYAGYDSSSLAYHPFLVADQQSKDMIDAWTAARKALAVLSPPRAASAKLFITGYSQGGFVAMATHRAMQQAAISVTASAPMSGPYALAAQTDEPFLGHVYFGATLFAALLGTSYQKVYRNIYDVPSSLYEAPYASAIESLLPGQDAAGLLASGALPEFTLFSRTPPQAPAGSALQALLNSATPPRGTSMDKVFDQGFGAPNLLTNAARLAYLQDALANPDGAVPVAGNRLPAAAPKHPLRIAARLNDLRGWTPAAPVLLCGGGADPTVPFDVNAGVMGALWAGLPTGRVTVLDVDTLPIGFADPYRAEKLGFAAIKAATILDAQSAGKDPDLALANGYHAGLLPFCNSAARTFFDGF